MRKMRRLVSLTLACLPGLFPAAHADTAANQSQITAARAYSNTDQATMSQLASLMQTWSAAAATFAHQVGSAVPWNQTNTQTPIQYAPMYLYAGPNGPGPCQFPGAQGNLSALPAIVDASGRPVNLSQPVNLAGLTINLSQLGSEQAKAYQAAIGAPNTFFPQNMGGPFNGTYCAAVAYNQPNAKQFQIVTWYAPSSSEMQATLASQRGGASQTPAMLLYGANQRFANAITDSALGGSARPIYYTGTGSGQQWLTQASSKAPGFLNGITNSLGSKVQSVMQAGTSSATSALSQATATMTLENGWSSQATRLQAITPTGYGFTQESMSSAMSNGQTLSVAPSGQILGPSSQMTGR
jgi:hypothetical protein